MKKQKVAVFFGGCSSEYGVSLHSASSVIRSINQEKYEIITVGITEKGDFYLYNGDVESIENDTWFSKDTCHKVTFSINRSEPGLINLETNDLIKFDIAFPVLHGKNGEDGRLQGLFELANIPYVGCKMTSSAICMDKYIAHTLVKDQGIAVPASHLFKKSATFEEIKKTISDLSYPVFVKPLKAGSSFGITKVNSEEDLKKAVDLAYSYDDSIIIEETIEGFEVGCAILGNTDLKAGEIDEIEIQGDFFDFEEKYTLKTSKIILPARLDEATREEIRKTAKAIYQALNCEGFARVDMFYTPEGKIVFNEVNTIPGCTSHSRYPSMLKEVGYSFETIIDELITLGLENAEI